MRTDDLDAVKSKLYDESEPFLSAHPNYDISTLPSWVAESIEVARVYGNSKKGVILPDGRKYHLDNHLNDLTGREWTFLLTPFFHTLSYQRKRGICPSYKENTSYAKTATAYA